MRRQVLVGAGVLVVLMGLVWMFQGLGLISGSFMSGSTTWAVIGPVVALVGAFMVVVGLRRR